MFPDPHSLRTLSLNALQISLLAACYWLSSQLGLALAIPPGYATAVWPATGIAVGAILVWGFRLLPGVWLGSTLTNIGIALGSVDVGSPEFVSRAIMASSIGLGAVAQAGVGASLVRMLVGYPNGYDTGRSVTSMLMLAGPAACVLSALWGCLNLQSFGLLSAEDWLFTAWTWWVGDAVGVLIFLPLMLLMFGEPKAAWRHRRYAVGGPLVFSFSAAVLIIYSANRVEDEQLSSSFERDAGVVLSQLRSISSQAHMVLSNASAYFSNVPDFTYSHFLDLVQPMLLDHGEIAAIGWVPRVPRSELQAFEARIASLDYGSFVVRQQGGALPQRTGSWSENVFPVLYVAPLQDNIGLVGLDMASAGQRLQALRDALHQNGVAMTPPLQSLRNRYDSGVILVRPVYAINEVVQRGQPRVGSLRGYAMLMLKRDIWLDQSLQIEALQHVNLRIMDVTEGSPGIPFITPERADAYLDLKLEGELALGGRRWHYSMRPSQSFIAHHRSFMSWTVLAGALAVSGLLGAFLLVVTGRLFRIEAAVNARTEKLNEEIIERKRAENMLRESEARYRDLAFHDSLTGLANREFFSRRLVQAVRDARQNGHCLAVHFFDLDHFKDINDAMGHPVGDGLLCRIAKVLQGGLRHSDLLARLGGDEFAILQPCILNHAQAAELAQRTICELVMPFNVDGYEVRTSSSVGIAVFNGQQDSAFSHKEIAVKLMEEADIALYVVKEHRRGGYEFHCPSMSERVHHGIRMGQALKQALAENSPELYLAYQPQVDTRTGQVCGYEALMRWQSNQLGSVDPSEFVAIAEARGLIVELGRYTLREACAFLGRTRATGADGKPIRVAVNVSVTQFTDPGFVNDVKRIITDAQVAPSAIELELTEAVLARSLDTAEKNMRDLRDFGVSIAIDDFGTGYSSLLYLKRMPVQRLKVAQEFVRDMLVDPADAEIVRATIQIAKVLELELIAEGVETAEHADHVAALGCEMAQGFYFGKPMDERKLMEQWQASGGQAA